MMKLTDLDFDCLEYVLEYLELCDLLNVADSTKRLRKAAELVYARKYAGKWVALFDLSASVDQKFEIKEERVQSYGFKTGLQLLRCFGCVIYKIGLKIFEKQLHRYGTLFSYINTYCADYLEEFSIKVLNRSLDPYVSDLWQYLDRPFKNLLKFKSFDSNFAEKSCLKRLFPKLQELGLTNCRDVSIYSYNADHFPYLETLNIGEIAYRETTLENEMVLPILKLNPQLTTLLLSTIRTCGYLNANLLRDAVNSLQNIESLTLDIKPLTNDGEFIHMKNVKDFSIGFTHFDVLPVHFLPFSFEKLEIFNIVFPEERLHSSFVQELASFIERHPTILHLHVEAANSPKGVDWSKMTKSLPLLVEFGLYNCWLSIEEALDIMSKRQKLVRLGFYLSNEFEDFCARLDKKWKATYYLDKFVTLINLN